MAQITARDKFTASVVTLAVLLSQLPQGSFLRSTFSLQPANADGAGQMVVSVTAPTVLQAGVNTVYTVTATNVGQGTVTNSAIFNIYKANEIEFLQSLSTGGCSAGYNASSNVNYVSCGAHTYSPGQSRTFSLVYRVSNVASCGLQIVNQTDIGGNNTAANWAKHMATVNCATQTPVTPQQPQGSPRLFAEKIAPQRADRGGLTNYIIHVENLGTAPATNVTVTDTLPSGITYSHFFSASQVNCSANGQTVTCNMGTLNPGIVRDVSLMFRVNEVTPCTTATITNTASVRSSEGATAQTNGATTLLTCPGEELPPAGPEPDPNTIPDQIPPTTTGGPTDLRVTKLGPATVHAGETNNYIIHVENLGQNDALNTIVTDVLPAGIEYRFSSTSGSCSISGRTLTCNMGTIRRNFVRDVSVMFRPATPCVAGIVTNTASVRSNNAETNQSNNVSNSVQTNIVCPIIVQTVPDLSITKSGPSSVMRGSSLTYTLNVVNNGNGAATSVTVTDPIPAGLNFHSSTSSQGCSQQGGNVVCTLGTVNAGQTKNLTLNFNVPLIDNCAQTSVQNTATVGATNASARTSNTVTTQIQCPVIQNPNLTITKSGPSSVVRGSTLQYVITVGNNGQAAASSVVVTDFIPSGVTFIPNSSDQSCSQQGSNISCNLGTINQGQTRTITLSFAVPTIASCTQTSVQNVAVANATNATSVTSNTVITQLTCPAQQFGCIEVVKEAFDVLNNPINPVPQFSFRLDNDRTEHNASNGRARFENVPVGTHTVTENVPSHWNLVSVVPSNGVVSVQANQCATVVFKNRQQLTPTSSSSSIPTQQSSSSVSPGQGCVEVVKEVFDSSNNQLSVVPQFVFTLDGNRTAVNASNGRARFDNVTPGTHTVTEQTVSGWTQITVTPANGSVHVPQNACATVIFKNRQNAVDTSDFTISKTDGRTTVRNGETITYTINVRNVSTQTRNANVIDRLPSGVTFLSASNNGSINGNVVTWNVTFAPNEERTMTVTVRVNDNVSGTLTNVAEVANRNSIDTTVIETQPQQDISLSKTDNRSTVEPGEELTYTITVRNNGTSDINNLDVVDILPDEVRVLSISDDGERNGRFITWDDVDLDSGDSETFTVRVEVDDDADGVLTNTVQAGGKTATDTTNVEEEDEDDDEDDDEDLELSVTKEADTFEVFPGGTVQYTLTIRNTGDATVEDIRVIDHLPSGVVIIDDGDADEKSGNRLEWEIDELEEDDTETIRYRVSIPSHFTTGQIVRNEVCVEADDDDIKECETVTVSVIGFMPQTGIMGRHNGSIHLRPITGGRSGGNSTLPMIFWALGLAVTGTGTGLRMGRRFLL